MTPAEATHLMLPAGKAVAYATCGARKKRTAGLCSKKAGWRTDHPGEGKCYLHGGRSPIKHGRYSKVTRPRIRDLIEAHAADPDPLNTLPELAAARALFQDFLERYDENTAALAAWHASRSVNPEDQEALFALLNEMEELQRGKGIELSDRQTELLEAARRAVGQLNPEHQRPRSILDISDAYRIVAEITRIVERIEKTASSITYEQLKRFLFGIERVLAARITDPSLLDQIRTDLLGVQVQ